MRGNRFFQSGEASSADGCYAYPIRTAPCSLRWSADATFESIGSNPTMRFEELPLPDRYAAESAASRFLARHRYISLDEACQTLDLTLPQLWSQIMRDRGLPDCDPPVFAPFA